MEEKLFQKLKSNCRLILTCTMILAVICLLWFAYSLSEYPSENEAVDMQSGKELLWLFAPVILLIGAITAAFVKLLPYRKDLQLIRKHEYQVIEATFLRYDYQRVNAKSSQMYTIPLFCDTLTREILTFSIDEELEQDVCYRIGYLPNTRTAVVELSHKEG